MKEKTQYVDFEVLQTGSIVYRFPLYPNASAVYFEQNGAMSLVPYGPIHARAVVGTVRIKVPDPFNDPRMLELRQDFHQNVRQALKKAKRMAGLK